MFKFTLEDGLKFTRGDTGEIRLKSIKDGTEYTDYTATLSIKKHINDKDYVIRKECDNNQFDFTHEETENLIPGKYVMDIEYRADGMVSTLGVWPCEILKDVTRG